MTSRAADRAGLAFILLLELVAFGWIVAAKRIPAGADGFQYLELQYVFLNNVGTAGEVPQWLPFMTHGTVANWWYFVQAGILQNALSICGGLLRGANMLYIFDAGVMFDRLLLLTGTWLLCSRLFGSVASRVFVTATVMGTAIGLTQPWFALHIYVALPLILYFGHRFLETARWRYFVAAANLTAIQALGNLPYFPPVTALVLCVYAGAVVAAGAAPLARHAGAFRPGRRAIAAIFLGLAPGPALYSLLTRGTAQIASYNVGRAADLSTTLEGFLTYGGNVDNGKWLELVVGLSPALDFNVFIGYLALPCVAAAFLSPSRRSFPFLLLSATLYALGNASPVASALYYLWPGMSNFRHLQLLAPLLRVCLVFCAGFGFEALVERRGGNRTTEVLLRVSGPILVVVACAVILLARNGDVVSLMHSICAESGEGVEIGLPRLHLPADYVRGRMWIAALGGVSAGVGLLLLARGRRSFSPRTPPAPGWPWFAGPYLTWALVAVQVASIGVYYAAEVRSRTVGVSEEQVHVLDIQQAPFALRRVAHLAATPRTALLGALTAPARLSWITQSFLFQDEVGSTLCRVDHWLEPLDELIRTWGGQDIADRSTRPSGLAPFFGFDFPGESAPARAVSGVTEDKIQFFSSVKVLLSDQAVSAELRAAGFDGSELLLASVVGAPPPGPSGRLHLPFEVRSFSANELVVFTVAPADAWLMYADVWHPNWQATVNGRAVPVERADLAYKAVRLDAGPNVVEFRFDIPWFSVTYFCIGANSLLWVGGVALLLVRALGPAHRSGSRA